MKVKDTVPTAAGLDKYKGWSLVSVNAESITTQVISSIEAVWSTSTANQLQLTVAMDFVKGDSYGVICKSFRSHAPLNVLTLAPSIHSSLKNNSIKKIKNLFHAKFPKWWKLDQTSRFSMKIKSKFKIIHLSKTAKTNYLITIFHSKIFKKKM